ncbi:cell envelope integrity protein TolA [Reinekea forsetii]|nr:cell envelope integrity protein TolA [Reinekea forsetii]
MSNSLPESLKIFGVPVAFSVVVHLVVAVAVFNSWSFSTSEPKAFEIPNSIRAEVVTIEAPKPTPKPVVKPKPTPTPKPVEKTQPAPKPKPKPVEQPKPKETVPKELATTPTAPPIEKEPEPTDPTQAELEQAAAEAAAKAAAEEAALFDDFLADLDAEDAEIDNKLAQLEADKARAEQIGAEINNYKAAITQQISSRWSRPAELRLKDLTGLEAKVSVKLLPTGELSSVQLIESSGMTTYDQSVLRAIERVRRFEVPEDPEVFEAGGFRSLSITFIPEDLMQP